MPLALALAMTEQSEKAIRPHPYNLLGMALRTKPKRPTCATSSPFSKSS
jgi:hypothetical protein